MFIVSIERQKAVEVLNYCLPHSINLDPAIRVREYFLTHVSPMLVKVRILRHQENPAKFSVGLFAWEAFWGKRYLDESEDPQGYPDTESLNFELLNQGKVVATESMNRGGRVVFFVQESGIYVLRLKKGELVNATSTITK